MLTETIATHLKYLINAGLIKGLVYCLLIFLPVIAFGIVFKVFEKKCSVRRTAFFTGGFFFLLYAVTIVVPYHFQGYATMPTTLEAAKDPSGILGFPPFGLFAYIFSTPFFGGLFLFFNCILIACGTIGLSKKIDLILRLGFVILHFVIIFNLGHYKRISLILDT